MKSYLLVFVIFVMACSTPQRKPSSSLAPIEKPKDALTLEQALVQGPDLTLQQIREKTNAASYPSVHTLEPMTDLPSSLLWEKSTPTESSPNRSQLLHHLRRFRPWALERKSHRAHQILDGFQCHEAVESQALGLSLERDYPEAEARNLSEALHDKVISCNDSLKSESLLRLAVFSIQKGQCPKALAYLKSFPPTPERGVNDRLAYLQSFCSPMQTVENRNPWGGYGVRLGDLKISDASPDRWFLSASSGSQDWDRLLVSLIELYQKNQITKLHHVASRLNYDKFRELPYPFQASFLVVLHYADADLTVFQTLHRFLADHPDLITREVVGLLFPVRYWKEILENSTGADPVLVKSLIRQESAFNPQARSRAKAFGLMQLIYPTAKIYGVKKPAQLLEPKYNIKAGSEFLGHLIQDFGSVELALAAYNAGPLVVRDWMKRYPTDNIDLFVEMIPYSETREYVRLVSRNYRIYQTLIADHYLEKPSIAQSQELLP